jgi:hypothetical protein
MGPNNSKKTSRPGCKGDPRMNRAVAERLRDPDLPLFHALRIGGFNFPANEDASTLDNDRVTLGQRKNQLSRRLRAIRKQEVHTLNEMPSVFSHGQVQDPEKAWFPADQGCTVAHSSPIDPLALFLQKDNERLSKDSERGKKRSSVHLRQNTAISLSMHVLARMRTWWTFCRQTDRLRSRSHLRIFSLSSLFHNIIHLTR